MCFSFCVHYTFLIALWVCCRPNRQAMCVREKKNNFRFHDSSWRCRLGSLIILHTFHVLTFTFIPAHPNSKAPRDIAPILVVDWKWNSGSASSPTGLCEHCVNENNKKNFVPDKKWNLLSEQERFRVDVHRMCPFLAACKFLVKFWEENKMKCGSPQNTMLFSFINVIESFRTHASADCSLCFWIGKATHGLYHSSPCDFYQRGRINYLNSPKKSCTAKLENENCRSKKTQKTGSRSIAPVAGFAGKSESTFCGHKNLKNHFLMSSLR
jgi:hypothetical protein